jgi:hypothetical protein
MYYYPTTVIDKKLYIEIYTYDNIISNISNILNINIISMLDKGLLWLLCYLSNFTIAINKKLGPTIIAHEYTDIIQFNGKELLDTLMYSNGMMNPYIFNDHYVRNQTCIKYNNIIDISRKPKIGGDPFFKVQALKFTTLTEQNAHRPNTLLKQQTSTKIEHTFEDYLTGQTKEDLEDTRKPLYQILLEKLVEKGIAKMATQQAGGKIAKSYKIYTCKTTKRKYIRKSNTFWYLDENRGKYTYTSKDKTKISLKISRKKVVIKKIL